MTFTAPAKGSWGCLNSTVFSITYRVTFGVSGGENLIPQQQPFKVKEEATNIHAEYFKYSPWAKWFNWFFLKSNAPICIPWKIKDPRIASSMWDIFFFIYIILLTKSLYECHAYPNSYKYLQISLSKYLSQWFLSSHFPHGHPRGNENTIHLGPEILACAHFLGLPLPSYMSLPQSPCLCKPVFSPTKGEELYLLHSIFVSFKWDNTFLVPDTH